MKTLKNRRHVPAWRGMVEDVRQWIQAQVNLMEWLFIFSVATFVLGILLAIIGIVCLPRDYFSSSYKPFSRKISNVFMRRAYLVGKNLIGGFFIIIGLALLVLPGQGILTIAIGISLTDFPGKHKMVGYLTRRGPMLRGANWLRSKAGRYPLDPFEER
jgi:hypothetical protein